MRFELDFGFRLIYNSGKNYFLRKKLKFKKLFSNIKNLIKSFFVVYQMSFKLASYTFL